MALYYTLPVYKSSYNLIFKIFSATKNFSREYKYTIGEELKKEVVFLVKNIYRANKSMDKTKAIEEARENLEVVRLYVRILHDFRQLSKKQLVEINLIIEDVSKQLASWEKYENNRKNTPPESPGGQARAQASVRYSKSNNPLISKKVRNKTHSSLTNLGKSYEIHKKIGMTRSEVVFPPAAGNRNRSSGGMNNVGSNGNYWSSTISGTNARNLNFNASSVNPTNTNNRANGLTVRCIKNLLHYV